MSDDLDWREKRREDKEEEEVGRRHKHKKHHKRKEKKRSRSRSRSKERKRSRSRERVKEDRRKREDDRDRDRDRDRHRGQKRSRSRERGGGREWERDRSDRAGKEREKRVPPTGPSSSDSDDDLANTVQPFSNTAVPEAGAKLKAEIERRKQLLGKKPAESTTTSASASSASVWKQTAFSNDSDGKVSAKFKRLMGIKDAEPAPEAATAAAPKAEGARQEYFENLEKQYEVARAQTHQQRGLGLGFGSRILPR